MKRSSFIKTLALFPLLTQSMKLNALHSFLDIKSTPKMPVLFLGHGSPMNAIEENEFVRTFRKIGEEIHTPRAIICISAHWETKGTYVTAMENPRTIHDFGGFPEELFQVKYPAKGSPEVAKETKEICQKTAIEFDDKWGLDHGAWSVLKHLYPNADIPVIQLSIDYTKPASYHYELAQDLKKLREKGVLIVGSGNIVHNLGKIAWNKLNGEPFAYDWATEVNEKIKSNILANDMTSLINYTKQGSAFELAIPTPEHYLPLLYTLGIKNANDSTTIYNDQPVAGSLYMTSFQFG